MISQGTQIDYMLESTIRTGSGTAEAAAPAGSFSKELGKAVNRAEHGAQRKAETSGSRVQKPAEKPESSDVKEVSGQENSSRQDKGTAGRVVAQENPSSEPVSENRPEPSQGNSDGEFLPSETRNSAEGSKGFENLQQGNESNHSPEAAAFHKQGTPGWLLMQHMSSGTKAVPAGFEPAFVKSDLKQVESPASVITGARGDEGSAGEDLVKKPVSGLVSLLLNGVAKESSDSEGEVMPAQPREKSMSGVRKELEFLKEDKSGPSQIVTGKTDPDMEALFSRLGLEGKSGSFMDAPGIIDKIRSLFMNSGVSTENFLVNHEGLDSLKAFLTGLGFDEKSVAGIIDDLKVEAGEGKDVKLTKVLSALEELEDPNMLEDQSFFMDASATPYLRDALKEFGLSDEETGAIIDKSQVENRGVSLVKLSGEIRSIMDTRQENNRPVEEKTAGRRVLKSLERVGIAFEKGENSAPQPLTLEKFASRIESMVQEKIGVLSEKPVLKDNLKGVFEGIRADLPAPSASQEVLAAKDQEVLRAAHMQSFPGQETLSSGAVEKEVLSGSAIMDQAMASIGKSSSAAQETAGKGNPENEKAARALEPKVSVVSKNMAGSEGKHSEKDNTGAGSRENGGFRSLPQGEAKISEEVRNQAAGFEREAEKAGLKDTPKAAASSTPAPAKTLPSYVLNQVGRQIQHSVQQSENEVRLQIKPPQMGKVLIEIESTTGGLRVSMTAEQNTVKDLLQAHAHELKATLGDQGIRVDKVDVQLSSDFDQFAGGAKQHQDQSKNRKNQPGSRAKKEKGVVSSARVENSSSVKPRLSSGQGLYMVA